MIVFKGLYHRRVFAVCLQIDSESYEWGLSARAVDLKRNPQRRMIIRKLSKLCPISSFCYF